MRGVVFDVAIPPENIASVLERMPSGAAVLIQKPLGRDLADAQRIVAKGRAAPRSADAFDSLPGFDSVADWRTAGCLL